MIRFSRSLSVFTESGRSDIADVVIPELGVHISIHHAEELDAEPVEDKRVAVGAYGIPVERRSVRISQEVVLVDEPADAEQLGREAERGFFSSCRCPSVPNPKARASDTWRWRGLRSDGRFLQRGGEVCRDHERIRRGGCRKGVGEREHHAGWGCLTPQAARGKSTADMRMESPAIRKHRERSSALMD